MTVGELRKKLEGVPDDLSRKRMCYEALGGCAE